jgi:D-methionine transport system ATP-binding protein
VFDNVALPLRLAHKSEDEIKTRVKDLLDIVNIIHREKAYPSQLSGGEKQRVAIARSLITNPELLLCDEATSALDPETTFAILKLLQKINREFGLSLLLITHEMSVIKEITDRVIVLDKGEIVEENKTIHVFDQPQSDIAKKFVNSLINKPLPMSVAAQLSDEAMRRGKIIRLVFKHHASTETVLSEMIRDLNLKVSILQANIEAVGEDTIGTLLIRLLDLQDEREAITYLQARHISVEEVSNA